MESGRESMESKSLFLPTRPERSSRLQSALAGNRRAFMDLVEPVGFLVHGAIFQVLGDAGAAREATVRVLEAAFADLKRCQDAAFFQFWLLRRGIAHAFKMAGTLRTEKQIQEEDPYSLPVDSRQENPRGGGEKSSRAISALEPGLHELPQKTRLVVYLRYFARLHISELAAVFETKPFRISRMLFQALEGLYRSSAMYHSPQAHARAQRKQRSERAGISPSSNTRSRMCMEARESRALLVDGDLSEDDLVQFRDHLRNCQACLEYLNHLKHLEQEIRGLFREMRITHGTLRLLMDRAMASKRKKGFLGWFFRR